MSSFVCEHCGMEILDSPNGYTTGCEHYPLEETMTKPNHAGTNANCWQCHYKKGVASRSYKGVRIPDGPGKCVRPGGLCDAKKAVLASVQVKMG